MKTILQNSTFFEEVKKRFYNENLLNYPRFYKDTNYVVKNFTFSERTKIVIEGQSGETAISEICLRERISVAVFNQWSQEFLDNNNFESEVNDPKLKDFTEDDKFKIVIEGKNGETSIAEICRRENITYDIFLDWSQEFLELRKRKLQQSKVKNSLSRKNELLISKFSNPEVFNYVENYINFSNPNLLVLLKADSIKLDKIKDIHNIISLQRINDVRYINKYFEKINSKLPNGGIFVGCLETFTARRSRMAIDKVPILNSLYFSFEFLFKRIIPKLSFTKKHYFDFTKGNDRLLSKAEGLGRLVSSGFKIMDCSKSINGLLYFVVKKEAEPSFDTSPSYGPVFKMPRLGKNGKIIGVYKFRTMHPYSEYLQDYVIKSNGYANTGKPAEDFRIPTWAKLARKFWLDELPQVINILKGEMKLVGIRPVSERYFKDIPKVMQKLRLTQKPGCIPPYVALNRESNVASVLQAEVDYLQEKIKNPYTTDIKYFFKAIFNILFKNKRSA